VPLARFCLGLYVMYETAELTIEGVGESPTQCHQLWPTIEEPFGAFFCKREFAFFENRPPGFMGVRDKVLKAYAGEIGAP
jgi:hypothetical protein